MKFECKIIKKIIGIGIRYEKLHVRIMNFKKLDNNEQRDALIGLVSFNQEITFFDFGSVAVQKKYLTDENVRIISGGRYFNGDFVGEGMLTCFIHGKEF